MKILVLAPCSKIMSNKQIHNLTCKDLDSSEKIDYHLKTSSLKINARELFRGAVNISLVAAIDQLRQFFDVSYYIVSSGFGLLKEHDRIPPYDCSFMEMNEKEIIARAEMLGIPRQFKDILAIEQPELLFLALNKHYLTALGNWEEMINCATITYTPSSSKFVISLPEEYLPQKETMHLPGFPVHNTVSYRGDLLLITKRYLANSKDPEKTLRELFKNPDELRYILNSIRQHGL